MYLCVITYQYPERPPFEVASKPTSKSHAQWLVIESGRLNVDSSHILAGRVYSEADYAAHLKLVA